MIRVPFAADGAEATRKLDVPVEVEGFAKERGLIPYWPRILEVLHRVFSDATQLTVALEDDPDEPDLRSIVFTAEVPWSKEQWRTGMKAWYRESAAACPAPLRHLFGLITHRRA